MTRTLAALLVAAHAGVCLTAGGAAAAAPDTSALPASPLRNVPWIVPIPRSGSISFSSTEQTMTLVPAPDLHPTGAA